MAFAFTCWLRETVDVTEITIIFLQHKEMNNWQVDWEQSSVTFCCFEWEFLVDRAGRVREWLSFSSSWPRFEKSVVCKATAWKTWFFSKQDSLLDRSILWISWESSLSLRSALVVLEYNFEFHQRYLAVISSTRKEEIIFHGPFVNRRLLTSAPRVGKRSISESRS